MAGVSALAWLGSGIRVKSVSGRSRLQAKRAPAWAGALSYSDSVNPALRQGVTGVALPVSGFLVGSVTSVAVIFHEPSVKR